jgi:hypothetical protein
MIGDESMGSRIGRALLYACAQCHTHELRSEHIAMGKVVCYEELIVIATMRKIPGRPLTSEDVRSLDSDFITSLTDDRLLTNVT